MTSESGDRKGTLTGFVPAEWVRADIKHTSSWWIIMHPTKPMHMLQRIKWISAPLSNAARTPFIASLLVKRKSVISSCFRLSDLYMFSMSASSWHWRGLSGRHLWTVDSNKNRKKFWNFYVTLNYLLTASRVPALQILDLGPIVKSLHQTSTTEDLCAISIPSCYPRDTTEIC